MNAVLTGVISNPWTAVPVGLGVLAAVGLVYYGVSCNFPNASTTAKVVYTAAICIALASTGYLLCLALAGARNYMQNRSLGLSGNPQSATAAQQALFLHQQQAQSAQQLFDQQNAAFLQQQQATDLLFQQQQAQAAQQFLDQQNAAIFQQQQAAAIPAFAPGF